MDKCEHGVSMEKICKKCEYLGDRAVVAGALTPKEIGLFVKGYRQAVRDALNKIEEIDK